MPIDNIVWDEPKDIVWDTPTQKNEFRKPLNLRENNAVDKFMSAIPKRGVMDVLDTIATQGYGRLTGNKEMIGAEAERQAKEWETQNPDIASKAGRLVGNIAATAPLAPSMGMGAAAANLPRLASALRTGGMTTGAVLPESAAWFGAKGADIGLRMVGGGLGGAAAGGLIAPSDMAKSGIVGAVLPPVIKGVGISGKYIGEKLIPDQQLMVDKLAKMTGKSTSDIAAKMEAEKAATAGTYDKNYRPAQLLNEPAFTMAEIVARGKSPKYGDQFAESDAAQNAARLQQIENIAPTYGSHNEAATNAGNAIQDYTLRREAQYRDLGGKRFKAVDPNRETAIELPLEAMQRIKNEFLGEGTDPSLRRKVESMLSNSEKLASQPYKPYVQSQKTGTSGLLDDISSAENELINLGKETANLEKGGGRTLSQEVRSLGGIKGYTGTNELSDLSRKNAGTTGLINNKSGITAERMVEKLRERGIIDHGDPAKLISQLQDDVRGIRHIPTQDTRMAENLWQAKANKNLDSGLQDYVAGKKSELDNYLQSLGGVDGSVFPPSVKTMPRQLPFETIKKQRESYATLANDQNLSNAERAAASGIVREIDQHLGDVIAGKGGALETMEQGAGKRYGKANQKWEDLQNRFKTGAQSGIFAERNGQPVLQGAQIADKFYNSTSKQVPQIEDFKRLIGYNTQLADELKRVATTKAKGAATADGSLSGSKLDQFIKNYSGANKGLLSEAENAKLAEILADVKRAEATSKAGLPKGQSATWEKQAGEQNLIGNSLLDNSLMNFLAYKAPVLRMAGAPMHSAAKTALETSRANQLAELMADTPNFMKQLEAAAIRDQKKKLANNFMESVLPLTYRAAPALSAQ